MSKADVAPDRRKSSSSFPAEYWERVPGALLSSKTANQNDLTKTAGRFLPKCFGDLIMTDRLNNASNGMADHTQDKAH
jgi:hypothetical protein